MFLNTHTSNARTIYISCFSEDEREKSETKEFEHEEEKAKRKALEAQLTDFARYDYLITRVVQAEKSHFERS